VAEFKHPVHVKQIISEIAPFAKLLQKNVLQKGAIVHAGK
jgi:hypothetical protein